MLRGCAVRQAIREYEGFPAANFSRRSSSARWAAVTTQAGSAETPDPPEALRSARSRFAESIPCMLSSEFLSHARTFSSFRFHLAFSRSSVTSQAARKATVMVQLGTPSPRAARARAV
ncbi:hypothetical protein GCM10029963_78070 [Micromonospora andamanensis]